MHMISTFLDETKVDFGHPAPEETSLDRRLITSPTLIMWSREDQHYEPFQTTIQLSSWYTSGKRRTVWHYFRFQLRFYFVLLDNGWNSFQGHFHRVPVMASSCSSTIFLTYSQIRFLWYEDRTLDYIWYGLLSTGLGKLCKTGRDLSSKWSEYTLNFIRWSFSKSQR
jgi:hypothetical protein